MNKFIGIFLLFCALCVTVGVLSAEPMDFFPPDERVTPTATRGPVATPTAVGASMVSAYFIEPEGVGQTSAHAASIPQRGDIIAQTIEGDYILIKPDGTEIKIDQQTFYAFSRDPALSVDRTFHLVVVGRNVLNQCVGGTRAAGSVAHAEGRKTFVEGLVAVDIRNLYGAVVQEHREILLFEALDPHHQGVGYVIPSDFIGIESISFGANERTSDLLLVLRRVTGTPAIFWLSPAAVYETAPYSVHEECHNARWRLHDCLMKYNRTMPKELILVRENAFNAVVVW